MPLARAKRALERLLFSTLKTAQNLIQITPANTVRTLNHSILNSALNALLKANILSAITKLLIISVTLRTSHENSASQTIREQK
jgi:hypothetical protein